ADDPHMNVRHVDTARQPIKAIVDSRFQVNEQARMFDGGQAWVFTCADDPEKSRRLADRNVQVVTLPAVQGRVDLHAMMQWMGEQAVNEVHVEAGARLSGALLQAQCADE